MELFTAGICFLLGLVLIVKGGDWFLDGAVWIAEVSGVPRFIVGANVIDLTLILPVCAALSDGGSLAIGRQTNVLDLPACLLAGAISMLPPLATGRFYRWQGFALLGGYAAYLMMLLR